MSEIVSKASTKRKHDDKKFSISIPSSTSLRNAIEIISNILTIATFTVEEFKDENILLRVDSLDAAQAAAVKVRLCYTGYIGSSDKITFACKIKTLLVTLKTLPPSEAIELFQSKHDETCVKLISSGMESHEYTIKSLDLDFEDLPIEDILSETSIEFEVERLKKYVAYALKIKSTDIMIQIIKLNNSEDIAIQFSVEGDEASGIWWFEGNTKYSDNGYYQLCSKDRKIEDGTLTFKAKFDINYIQQFIKSMERNSVVLTFSDASSMGEEKEEGGPLIMEYRLGQEESSVRFVLAAKYDDDENLN